MSRSRVVTVGLIQRASHHDRDANIETTREGIREAAEGGADLAVLMELCSSDYFCQTEDPTYFNLAEPLDGVTVSALAETAKANRINVVVPFFERRAPGVYHNTLVVLGRGGERLGVYRKMHIPHDPQFFEKYYFTPGDLGFSPINISEARLGTLICWDQWYPEAARAMALAGAEILIYPTAIGWMPEERPTLGDAQLDAWRTIQRSHAIANGLYVVAVNRVGLEGAPNKGITFWGHSLVCDPAGSIIAEADEEEMTLIVPCELQQIEEQRRAWPFFRDRRIDAYDSLTSRWRDSEHRS